MNEAFLLDYLNTLIAQMEQNERPYLHHPFVEYKPDEENTQPFRLLKTLSEQVTHNNILLPYYYRTAGDLAEYGFTYYQRNPKMILYSNVNGLNLRAIRGEGLADFTFICLEKPVSESSTESGYLVAALYTWCLSAKPFTDKGTVSESYKTYTAQIRLVLKNERLTLSQLIAEMRGLHVNTMTLEERQLTAQKHFWIDCDDHAKEQCLRSPKIEKKHIYQLFDFSCQKSYAIFYRFLVENPQNPDRIKHKKELFLKLLKIKLGHYEILAIEARIQRTKNYKTLTMDLAQTQETVMDTLATLYSHAEPSNQTLPFCIPWEQLRRKYHTHNFGLAQAALARQNILETSLIKDILSDLALCKSPAHALLALFGGHATLYIKISMFYHTLKDKHADFYLGLNTDLCLLNFDAFTPEYFNTRSMMFEKLLYEALAIPKFILRDALFALVVCTYQKLTGPARELLIDQVLLVLSQQQNHDIKTQTACLASLLSLDMQTILPKILDYDSNKNSFKLNAKVVVFCLIRYCQYTPHSLINLFHENFTDFSSAPVETLFAALNIHGVPVELNTAAIDTLLDSTVMLPATLTTLYFNHLVVMMNEGIEASVKNVLEFLLYCQLIFDGSNLFNMLFENALIPQDMIKKLSLVVLYAARQWKNLLESGDANSSDIATYKMLLTDFLSFMQSDQHTESKKPLEKTRNILGRDFKSLALNLKLDAPRTAQAVGLFGRDERHVSFAGVSNRFRP